MVGGGPGWQSRVNNDLNQFDTFSLSLPFVSSARRFVQISPTSTAKFRIARLDVLMEARLRLCLARFLLLLFLLAASGSKLGGTKLAPVDSYLLPLE